MNADKVKKYCNVILPLIIIIQLIYFSVVFAGGKTAYHEDEYFSYGLSNSYNRPFLNGSGIQMADNYNSWETGDSFKYYIRTTKDTRFNYPNVWRNQSADIHPPLYYALLHTISSFFPEKFSWWWGFVINLAAFAVTQIYLYKWVKTLGRSELSALVACVFCGFSLAGLNMMMFIRMYSLLTMFSVMFAYYSQRALMSERLSIKRDLIPIMAVTLLGALTQHLFLVFAFIFTLLQCIYFLLRKRFYNMLAFGLAALIGALLSFAFFPASISHIFSDHLKWTQEPDLSDQLFFMMRIMVRENTGYHPLLFKGYTMIYVRAALIFIIVLSIPILYLLRDKLGLKDKLIKIKDALPSINYSGLIVFLTISAYYIFVSGSFYYYDIMEYADRYLFMIMPLTAGIVISAVTVLVSFIKVKSVKSALACVLSAALAALILYQNIFGYRDMYIFHNGADNGSVGSYINGQDGIMLLSSAIAMPCYCTMLENAGDVFISLTQIGVYDTQEENYRRIFDENDEFFLLIDQTDLNTTQLEEIVADKAGISSGSLTETEIVGYFEDISGFKSEYCTAESTHGESYRVALYRFVRK